MLGISSESARELGKRMEWAFALLLDMPKPMFAGNARFQTSGILGIRTMLSLGEMLHLAVMLNEKERERQNPAFSFALPDAFPVPPDDAERPAERSAHPRRRPPVRVPAGRKGTGWRRPRLRPGPPSCRWSGARCCRRTSPMSRPASATVRGCSTCSGTATDEQVRGVSAFSKGIELFRNLSDAISYELFAQVIAASFPAFVALENGGVQLPDYVTGGAGRRRRTPGTLSLSKTSAPAKSSTATRTKSRTCWNRSALRPTSPRCVEMVLQGDGGLRGHPLRIADERLFQRPTTPAPVPRSTRRGNSTAFTATGSGVSTASPSTR